MQGVQPLPDSLPGISENEVRVVGVITGIKAYHHFRICSWNLCLLEVRQN